MVTYENLKENYVLFPYSKFEAIQSKGIILWIEYIGMCQNVAGQWLVKRVEVFLEAIKRLERSTILIIIVMPRKGINNH